MSFYANSLICEWHLVNDRMSLLPYFRKGTWREQPWRIERDYFRAGGDQTWSRAFTMKFRELMEIVADEPVFEVGLLMAGESESADLRKQLSRWSTGSNRKL